MKTFKLVMTGLLIPSMAFNVMAAVSEQEAAQLGTTLTLFGAEKAGNADGSIPPYTGGLPVDTAPPGWKKGSGRYEVAPWDKEKPLFSITPVNAEKYADKLTPGVQELLKRHANLRLDVYPTHRSASYDNFTLGLCKNNALKAQVKPSGNGVENAHGCAPFPIPKNGIEVMWNFTLRNIFGPRIDALTTGWLVDTANRVTDTGNVYLDFVQPYLDRDHDTTQSTIYQYRIASWAGPSSQVGTKILQHYPLDYDTSRLLSWIYTPGQRRTRLAPEFAYDTPVSANGGAINYDEPYGFAGQLDRYDFKLVGKKEMYVPYNPNRELYAPVDKLIGDGIVNPDLNRWELHRVWVVEGTLKEGKRHSQPRRTFYIDEDTWAISVSDAYDQGGRIFRVGLMPVMSLWDTQTFYTPYTFYDMSKGNFHTGGFQSRPTDYLRSSSDMGKISRFTEASLSAKGIR